MWDFECDWEVLDFFDIEWVIVYKKFVFDRWNKNKVSNYIS